MGDVCLNYLNKINENMNFLPFVYGGNPVNFELSFKDQANSKDINNHEMKILVKYLKKDKLLENIKSIYTVKIIFSHLNEKIKLKTIKYNKHLQNEMDIKLINYKFYSEKYIEYESNVKGKEYSGINNYLLFEGEYLNGERNGNRKRI